MNYKTLLITLFTFIISSNLLFSQENDSILNTFIEKKRSYNKSNKSGVNILLYSGNEENARRIYSEFQEEFSTIQIKLTYVSPDWKVVTTPYSSALEAEKVAILIREKYPLAKIL